jgi:hypothetical protein
MWPTLRQLFGTVVNANAIISLAASTSHNLNSTLNFSSTLLTLPVISACALIKFQSSNLGFRLAMSGACKKASLLKGLNNPDVLKLFSTIFEISSPMFSFFIIISKTLDFFLAISVLSVFVSYNWGEKRFFYLLLVGIIFPFIVFVFFEMILGLRFPPGIITNLYYY